MSGRDRTPLDDQRLVQVSKYLAKHLRHRPERLGLTVQPGGWVPVTALLEACARARFPISRDELDEVVARNDKRRFGFDEDRQRIRAHQGHSIEVDLHLVPSTPPPTLFHGTHPRALEAIRREGLLPMGRHHVHLSSDLPTALRVGARRGQPVVLEVDAGRMASDGHVFSETDNGVWLVAAVPVDYLSRASHGGRTTTW